MKTTTIPNFRIPIATLQAAPQWFLSSLTTPLSQSPYHRLPVPARKFSWGAHPFLRSGKRLASDCFSRGVLAHPWGRQSTGPCCPRRPPFRRGRWRRSRGLGQSFTAFLSSTRTSVNQVIRPDSSKTRSLLSTFSIRILRLGTLTLVFGRPVISCVLLASTS